jgi:hypothetical protein
MEFSWKNQGSHPYLLTRFLKKRWVWKIARPMLVGDGPTLAGERSAKTLAEMRARGAVAGDSDVDMG